MKVKPKIAMMATTPMIALIFVPLFDSLICLLSVNSYR
jgi:hypothetical protein